MSATDRARAAKPEAKAARSIASGSCSGSPPSTVGETTCLTCHDQKYRRHAHAVKANIRTPAAIHTAARAVTAPGKPTWTAAATRRRSSTPRSCPRSGPARPARPATTGAATRSGRAASTTRATSAASTCHSVHTPKGPKQLKAASELALCASCHRDKVAKLDRSGHMPVREGKMQCSTCHNPHGATNVKLLRQGDSIAEACTSCHADKRGPYLWEHAPGRDGCTTCHDPHGSSNERMLVSKPPILCQRCHVATRHPSTIYDAGLIGAGATPSVRIYARSCVTCHSAIHGSNHPSGQRFIR